jgi:hypothetical protein
VIANILFILLGTFIGIAVMALVSINRYSEDDDSELLDFMTRNDLGLTVVHDGDKISWAVVSGTPAMRVIGDVLPDPREAIASAQAVMEGSDRG